MSLAAWSTPFLTTDQKGSDAWPCVTTEMWMLERAPPVCPPVLPLPAGVAVAAVSVPQPASTSVATLIIARAWKMRFVVSSFGNQDFFARTSECTLDPINLLDLQTLLR